MSDLLSFAWKDTLSFLFIFLRIGIIFAVIPFFSAELIPRRVTAILTFFLSLVLLPVVPAVLMSMEGLNILALTVLAVHELLIGLCLALAVNVIFAGAQIAGELVGFQMGFSIVNVVDPITGADAPITANLLYIVTFLLFLSFGGHHLLIKALVESFTLIPVEAALPQKGYLIAVISYCAHLFVIALKIAAPVIGVLLLINVAFAITARAIPQMNVFLMSFPITIAIGLSILIIVIKMLPGYIRLSLAETWSFIQSTMSLF